MKRGTLASAMLMLAGTMASAGAATWSPPQTLVSMSSGVRNPSVATNASGLAVATWVGGDQVMVARRAADGTWSTPIPLSAAGQGATTPRAAVAPDGTAVVAWLQDPALQSAHAAFFDGVQWLPDSTVSTAGADANAVQVAFDAQGTATLVFQEIGSACSINAMTGTAAAGWSAPQPLSADCYTYLQFAMNSQGEAALAWGATALQGGAIVVVTRDASGTWGAPVTLSQPYYRQLLPSVAIGEDGTAIVLWGKYTVLKWSRRPRGAGWSPPRDVVNAYAALSGVAIDGGGNAVAIYNTYTVQGTYALRAARLARHAQRWGSQASLTTGAQSVVTAQLVCTPAGTFIAGWTGSPATRAMVSTLEPGTANWSTTNLGYGDWEIAAAAAPGSGVVVWETIYTPVPSIMASAAVIP